MSTLNEKRQRTADNLKRVSFRDTSMASMVMMLFEAFGIGYNNGYAARDDLRMRMVKLIDPEPERTCHIKLCDYTDSLGQKMYRCSECGALMTDDACFFEGELDVDRFSYCPSCGAKVVDE